MVGEWRRRRRRRVVVRNVAGVVVAAVVVAVVVIVAVAAVAQIRPTSGPYYRTVDRSYAGLAAPLVAESNTSAAVLKAFWADGPSLTRKAYFAQLDELAAGTSDVLRQFKTLSPPWPVGKAGSQCLAALEARAGASASIQAALEALVGGRTGVGGGDEATATGEVVSAASSLSGADRSWARCRRDLRRDPGSARLAASVWMRDPGAWAASAVDDFVAAAVASPSLVAVHAVAIVAAATDPTAVAGADGTAAVTATNRLDVRVVVDDEGNVTEQGVEVTAVASRPGSPSSSSHATADLVAGSSVALVLPSLSVRPDATYSIEVTASVPGASGPQSLITTSFPIYISAEPVVPTTTTTTTTTTSPTTPSKTTTTR
jgi:hypothetical protein